MPEGVSYVGKKCNKKNGKLSVKAKKDADTGETKITFTIKALKPGRFNFVLYYHEGEKTLKEPIQFVFINGFRGKAKLKKTDDNYRMWRKKTISTIDG